MTPEPHMNEMPSLNEPVTLGEMVPLLVAHRGVLAAMNAAWEVGREFAELERHSDIREELEMLADVAFVASGEAGTRAAMRERAEEQRYAAEQRQAAEQYPPEQHSPEQLRLEELELV